MSRAWLPVCASGLFAVCISASSAAFAQSASPAPVVHATAASASPSPSSRSPSPATVLQSSGASLLPMPSGQMMREAETMVERGEIERVEVARACNDIHNIDWELWSGALGLVGTGLALVIYSYPTPGPQRNGLQDFGAGIGPGLILGGIGFPFGRGVVKDQDPVEHACERVVRPPAGAQADAVDVDVASHLMRDLGPAMSPILIGLLAGATALCVIGTSIIVGLALSGPPMNQFYEIIQVAGGVDAGIVTGWLLLPPAPERQASTHYATGWYLRHSAPHRRASITLIPTGQGGIGFGVGGVF